MDVGAGRLRNNWYNLGLDDRRPEGCVGILKVAFNMGGFFVRINEWKIK